jgi:CRP-like cAMP-binding protein
MSESLILRNIGKHIFLDPGEASYFMSLVKQKNLSKKQFVLSEGQACKYINFVETGAVRAYYSDSSGKEATIMFALADWWVTDMHSFINEQPAMLHIQAIEESCIFQLKKEALEGLYQQVPKFERFFRIIMQNAYIREQLRVIQNLSLSAEDRYQLFLSKYPQVVNLVTQKQIASYLGITPEFLSMIRRNGAQNSIS